MPEIKLHIYQRVFPWDFISGVLRYFHFGVWSISYYNCYITQPEMKLIAGVISLRSFWQELNFISRDKMSCKHYPKWNKIKGNIYFIKTKIIGFYSIGRFSQTTPETKFHFILPAMRSNVNRISFTVGWNFISGGFHFGSHVNTLSEWPQWVSFRGISCKQSCKHVSHVTGDWLNIELKVLHFAQYEISCKYPLNVPLSTFDKILKTF